MGGVLTTLGVQLPKQQLDAMQKKIDKLEKANAISRATNDTLRRKMAEMTAMMKELTEAKAQDAASAERKLEKVVAAHEETKRALRKAEVELAKKAEFQETQKQAFLKEIQSLRSDYQAFEDGVRKRTSLLVNEFRRATGAKPPPRSKLPPRDLIRKAKLSQLSMGPVKIDRLPAENVKRRSRTTRKFLQVAMTKRFLRIEIENFDSPGGSIYVQSLMSMSTKSRKDYYGFEIQLSKENNNELKIKGGGPFSIFKTGLWNATRIPVELFKHSDALFVLSQSRTTRQVKTLPGGRRVTTVAFVLECKATNYPVTALIGIFAYRGALHNITISQHD